MLNYRLCADRATEEDESGPATGGRCGIFGGEDNWLTFCSDRRKRSLQRSIVPAADYNMPVRHHSKNSACIDLEKNRGRLSAINHDAISNQVRHSLFMPYLVCTSQVAAPGFDHVRTIARVPLNLFNRGDPAGRVEGKNILSTVGDIEPGYRRRGVFFKLDPAGAAIVNFAGCDCRIRGMDRDSA